MLQLERSKLASSNIKIMAPKSAALLFLQGLKEQGASREEATKLMQEEHPTLSRSRRSQLLSSCYGKVKTDGDVEMPDKNDIIVAETESASIGGA